MTEDEIISAARQKLSVFAHLIWDKYVSPHHVHVLCRELEMIERGETKRLLVTMPPRHSKSMNVGEYFPAWFLGKNPDQKIIYATYEQHQAEGYGRKVRNTLQTDMFNQIFPECNLSKDSKSAKKFDTLEGGTYYALSQGSAITGKGGHVIILDDLIKGPKEAANKKLRKEIIEWYESVVLTRREGDAPIVVCATRWNEGDLIGHLLKTSEPGEWRHVDFPAINEKGEALWPERYDLEWLNKTKDKLSPYFWSALYQQRPSPQEGNRIKRKDIKRWFHLEANYDSIIQSWDFSFKGKNTSSYVVGQIWGKKGVNLYLLDQFRAKVGLTGTIKAFLTMTAKWPQARKKYIEDKANGPGIMDLLKSKVPGIVEVNPSGSKEERLEAVTYLFEGGNVHVPDSVAEPWVKEYIDELVTFPNSDYDDQVDTTTQALEKLGVGDPLEELLKFNQM